MGLRQGGGGRRGVREAGLTRPMAGVELDGRNQPVTHTYLPAATHEAAVLLRDAGIGLTEVAMRHSETGRDSSRWGIEASGQYVRARTAAGGAWVHIDIAPGGPVNGWLRPDCDPADPNFWKVAAFGFALMALALLFGHC